MVGFRSSFVFGFSAGVYASAISAAAATAKFIFNCGLGGIEFRVAEASEDGDLGRFAGGVQLELVGRVDLLGLAALGTCDTLASRSDLPAFSTLVCGAK